MSDRDRIDWASIALIAIEGDDKAAKALVTEGVGRAVALLDNHKLARAVVQELMDFANAVDRMKSLVE